MLLILVIKYIIFILFMYYILIFKINIKRIIYYIISHFLFFDSVAFCDDNNFWSEADRNELLLRKELVLEPMEETPQFENKNYYYLIGGIFIIGIVFFYFNSGGGDLPLSSSDSFQETQIKYLHDPIKKTLEFAETPPITPEKMLARYASDTSPVYEEGLRKLYD